MQIEEEERARIQRMKDEECTRAIKELEDWKAKKREAEEEEEARRRKQEAATQETRPVHQHRKPEKVLTPGVNLSQDKGKKTTTHTSPDSLPVVLSYNIHRAAQVWILIGQEGYRGFNIDINYYLFFLILMILTHMF